MRWINEHLTSLLPLLLLAYGRWREGEREEGKIIVWKGNPPPQGLQVSSPLPRVTSLLCLVLVLGPT